MKTKILIVAFIFFSLNVVAQKNKGNFFVETGLKAFGGGDFVNFIGKTGISFNQHKWETFHADDSPFQEGTYSKFSWSAAPRLGYCFSNFFQAGIDVQHYQDIASYGFKYRNTSSGLFLRFNIIQGRVSPFIELTSGIGLSKSLEDRSSPGGGEYQLIEKYNLFYYSGSGGVKFDLNKNFNLNLSARIQNTLENEPKNKDEGSVSYLKEKKYNLEIGPMLSITYIFNKKSQEKYNENERISKR